MAIIRDRVWICRPRRIVLSFGTNKGKLICDDCRAEIGEKCSGPEHYVSPSLETGVNITVPLGAFEKMKQEAVALALHMTNGNKSRAARLLNITVKTLTRVIWRTEKTKKEREAR